VVFTSPWGEDWERVGTSRGELQNQSKCKSTFFPSPSKGEGLRVRLAFTLVELIVTITILAIL
jgi:prepilin-type N-terminal cleavage/methylation domain-containing protein